MRPPPSLSFFFFNDTATTEIYTLSLHDALPISGSERSGSHTKCVPRPNVAPSCSSYPFSSQAMARLCSPKATRSEEHTSELQSPCNLVCRLLLEKKKKTTHYITLMVSQYNVVVT